MSAFKAELRRRETNPNHRRWIFVPYDQLNDGFGPLSREDPRKIGIILVETPWKAARRPYHKQKLALIIGNTRQFALEQAARGVAVHHMVVAGPYRDAIEQAKRDLGAPIRVMRPAERELRVDLGDAVEILPHEGWLTTRDQFRASHTTAPPWLLERFYRHVRNQTGILMENGQPTGGQYNYDKENRHAWKNGPAAPIVPTFASDSIKQEVGDLIASHYAHHPGVLDLDHLPTTAADAEHQWAWAQQSCLPSFGRYEDAMSMRSSGLFHTRISPLLNIHRLLPARVLADAVQLDIPIASKEGFIRQILGWREFMRHMHEETDGFRTVSQNALGFETPLPPAYWGEPSGMNCLDTVIADVWREAWSHHITRLMVLANFATLLDVVPRELTDWFWVAYADAYDWVVEPNVLGLGTFGLGRLFTTKPYVSGGNYINKMSDYCKGCQFDPARNCPFTSLYWAFMHRHRSLLERNSRLNMPFRALDNHDSRQDVFVQIRDKLVAGKPLTVADTAPWQKKT